MPTLSLPLLCRVSDECHCQKPSQSLRLSRRNALRSPRPAPPRRRRTSGPSNLLRCLSPVFNFLVGSVRTRIGSLEWRDVILACVGIRLRSCSVFFELGSWRFLGSFCSFGFAVKFAPFGRAFFFFSKLWLWREAWLLNLSRPSLLASILGS